MAASIVSVSLNERSYKILIQAGLLRGLGARLDGLGVRGKAGIVTDRHVAPHYLRDLVETLKRGGIDAVPIVLPPGEQSKTLDTVGHILDVLARNRFERSSYLFALGGGVVGDLAGFAAAIYQRGMPFIQIPTTLIAQADSSVGGKTGVDHRLGKNLIGAFYQPKEVWIDPLTLCTLPMREWVAGLAEVIKYGIIADEAFFSYLERTMPRLRKRDATAVAAAVKRSCEIKAEVVASDERESDRRRILNYGHTIGHALETLGGYESLVHGEAIGIGLVQEADLACYMGLCDRTVVERILTVVQAAGLSGRMPSWQSAKIWKAMLHDKKVSHGQVVGVWPERIGQVRMMPIDERSFRRWHKAVHQETSGRRPFRARAAVRKK
ncbi:MAG TPA: 3-dehydroquinate synthase [Nitrospira sp.]|nr:3-dehydroquinate synthase [Nitrospira sp.]